MPAMLKLMRPKQWIKNGFVFAALVFSMEFTHVSSVVTTVVAALYFCLASSWVYILNDLKDAEKDRQHPRKRLRPIASGKVSPAAARTMLIVLLPVILTVFLWHPLLGLAVAAYLVNNLLYTYYIKHVVLLDVFSIAAGFLLRVVGGAVAIRVGLSPWILLCTLLLALFLGFSKRRHELLLLADNAESHRKILEEYSVQMLDNILSVVTASTVMAYSLYTFTAHTGYGMMLTIPFVLYGVFRYQYLVYKKDEGGSPDETLMSDKPLLVNVALWMLSSAAILWLKL